MWSWSRDQLPRGVSTRAVAIRKGRIAVSCQRRHAIAYQSMGICFSSVAVANAAAAPLFPDHFAFDASRACCGRACARNDAVEGGRVTSMTREIGRWKGLGSWLVLVAILLPAFEAIAAGAPLSCPLKLTNPTPGWWRGHRDEPQRLKATARFGRLDELWLVAGKKGEEAGTAPAILAPDRPPGEWDVSAETGGLVLVCLYQGSGDYLATALPSGLKRCRWAGPSASGAVLDGGLACQ